MHALAWMDFELGYIDLGRCCYLKQVKERKKKRRETKKEVGKRMSEMQKEIRWSV